MTDVDMSPETNNSTTETTQVNPLDEVFLKIDEMAVLAAYLKKVVKPLLKKAAKTKRRSPDGERARNGFQSPVIMAPVLVEFLRNNFPDRGFAVDKPLPRTDVTQLMTTYIKTSNLQIAENRKNFTVDKELAKVFNIEEGYVSNWFEMQKFMRTILTSIKNDGTTNKTVSASGSSSTDTNADNTGGKTSSAPPSKRIKKGI